MRRGPNFVPLPFAGALLRGLQVIPTGLGREMKIFQPFAQTTSNIWENIFSVFTLSCLFWLVTEG